MMLELNADYQDTLKELLNISMGQAADKLARLLDLHVTLTVPDIKIASKEELDKLQQCESEYHFTRQSFYGGMSGELVTLLSKNGCKQIAADMTHDESEAEDNVFVDDCLLDISNILSGASLKGLCQQIELNIKIQPPSLFKPSVQTHRFTDWNTSILMEVSFIVEAAQFETKTIIFFANNGLDQVLVQLDDLL
ncbi:MULTISPECIES: chemotaxis protein CheX [Vibrio]|uniref:Chemotaxis protein CheC n=2 Tax=Vibrio TaxID=662 RepID=A0A7X4LLC4_9VIBR|nr:MULTISPECIES: chemotaxis protein CheX [Vibrio]MBF9002746.1 chemotaxis protein CheC [Vibrio nitrifigilis]MZI93762.1 chemotaxis protein CheC [Vibrio eleionomae]